MKKSSCAVILAALGVAGLTLTSNAAGPDVLYSAIGDTQNHGTVGAIRAYTLGTNTCNIGNQNLLWLDQGTPAVAFNMYRLYDGRLTQLGLGFAKTACCAAAGSGCGFSCNGQGGSVLGAGCLDVYSAGWNAQQSALAPRSVMNAWTGSIGAFPASSGNAIFRRLQVQQADLNTTTFPGSQFFVEGVYVATDDANNNNRDNNATYRSTTVNQSTFNLTLVSNNFAGQPAITAWRTHGLGLNQADTSVNLATLDVPGEGRFHYAYKVRDNGNGTWRYEYAVFNLSSDRSGGSFSVPVPASAVITNAGFASPDYHSSEPYSNADWTITTKGGAVTWATPETFAQNANSSALRWGTMYNFWFDANRAPGNVVATLGLFKPHVPQNVTLTVSGPIVDCPQDITGNDEVDIDDLLAVIGAWGACVDPENCPADIVPKGGNDQVDIDDLLSVIGAWGPCS